MPLGNKAEGNNVAQPRSVELQWQSEEAAPNDWMTVPELIPAEVDRHIVERFGKLDFEKLFKHMFSHAQIASEHRVSCSHPISRRFVPFRMVRPLRMASNDGSAACQTTGGCALGGGRHHIVTCALATVGTRSMECGQGLAENHTIDKARNMPTTINKQFIFPQFRLATLLHIGCTHRACR